MLNEGVSFMKNLFQRLSLLVALVFMISVLLPGCTTGQAKNGNQPETLDFPGLTWSMDSSQIIAALNLTKDQFEQDDLNRITVSGLTCFGVPVQSAIFVFGGAEKTDLCEIMLKYPADADMDTVKANLISLYGDPDEEHIAVSIGGHGIVTDDNGKSSFYDDRGISLKQMLPTAHTVYWDSPATLGAVYDAAGLKIDTQGSLTSRMTQILADTAPFSFIIWSDDGGDDYYTAVRDEDTQNFVCFMYGFVGGGISVIEP